LDNAYANCEEEKGQPLERAQLAAEKNDGESGSGKDFHLVGNLEGSGLQIRGGNKLKIILNDVEYGWDRQLPAVGSKNLLSNNSTPL